MKNVLITGATGFIGRHVVKANLAKGNRVRALVLLGDTGEVWLKEQGVEVVNGDIRDYEAVRCAVGDVDIIFINVWCIDFGVIIYVLISRKPVA
jgi:nucleoside-diphosphate-sugar epimerase